MFEHRMRKLHLSRIKGLRRNRQRSDSRGARLSLLLAIAGILLATSPTALAAPKQPPCWEPVPGAPSWWVGQDPEFTDPRGGVRYAVDPHRPSTVYMTNGSAYDPDGNGPEQAIPLELKRSDDGGCSWTDLDPPDITPDPQGWNRIDRIVSSHKGHESRVYMVMENSAVVISRDGGKTWDVPLRPLSPDGSWFEFDILVAPTDPDVVYVAAKDHGVFSYHELYASEDGGETWVKRAQDGLNPVGSSFTVGADGIANNQALWDYYVDPLDPEELWATNGNAGLLHSLDGGESWKPTQVTFENAMVSLDIARLPGEKARLVLVVDEFSRTEGARLYWSTDAGLNWSKGMLPDPVYDDNVSLYSTDLAHGSTSDSLVGNFEFGSTRFDEPFRNVVYRLNFRAGKWVRMLHIDGSCCLHAGTQLSADRKNPFLYMLVRGRLRVYTGSI